jgi:hypothetical protein
MLSLCSSGLVYLNWLFHEFISSDVRMMNESGMSKNLEGSGRGLRRECCRNFRTGTLDIHDYPRIEQGAFLMEVYSVTNRYQVCLWRLATIPFKHI